MQRSRTVSGSARNPSCVVWPGMVTVTGNDVGAHSHQARFFKRQGGRITLSASAALIQEQAAEPAQALVPLSVLWTFLTPATCVLLAAKLNSLHDLTYCPLILMPGTEVSLWMQDGSLPGYPPTPSAPPSLQPRASTPPSALPCSLLGCFLVPEAALSLAQALDDVQSSQGAVKAADQWQFGWGLGGVGSPTPPPQPPQVQAGGARHLTLAAPRPAAPDCISALWAVLQPQAAGRGWQAPRAPLPPHCAPSLPTPSIAEQVEQQQYQHQHSQTQQQQQQQQQVVAGERVLVVGSPFGCLAPHQFADSAMLGVVSHLLPTPHPHALSHLTPWAHVAGWVTPMHMGRGVGDHTASWLASSGVAASSGAGGPGGGGGAGGEESEQQEQQQQQQQQRQGEHGSSEGGSSEGGRGGEEGVTKDAGSHASMQAGPAAFLLDAPCLPGMEGALVLDACPCAHQARSLPDHHQAAPPAHDGASLRHTAAAGAVGAAAAAAERWGARRVLGLLALPLTRPRDAVQLPLAVAWPHLHHALLAFNSARQDQQGGQDQQDLQPQQGPQLRAARLALDPSAPLAAKSTPAKQPSTPPPSTAPHSQQVSKQQTASGEPALGHPGVQAFQGGEVGPLPGLGGGAQACGNADRQPRPGPGTTPAGKRAVPPSPQLHSIPGGDAGREGNLGRHDSGATVAAGTPDALHLAPCASSSSNSKLKLQSGRQQVQQQGHFSQQQQGQQPCAARCPPAPPWPVQRAACSHAAAAAVATDTPRRCTYSCPNSIHAAALSRAQQAVVMIRARGAWATGVIITPCGLLITNAHLLLPAMVPSAGISHAVNAETTHAAAQQRRPGRLAQLKPQSVYNIEDALQQQEPQRQGHRTSQQRHERQRLTQEQWPGLVRAQHVASAAGPLPAPPTFCSVRVTGADGALRWLTARVLYVFTNHLDLAVLQLQPALEPEGYAALGTRCGSQHWPRSRLQRHASALQQLHDSLGSGGECDKRVTLPPSSSGPASCDGHVASDRCLALRRPDSGFAADLDGEELGPGDEVWVVGHGLFGPAAGWQPAVTAGNVAKVVRLTDGRPGMLVTTATVQSGASGAAVLDSEGRLCGLVTSNARHASGATLPHLNFCIPLHTQLQPVLAALLHAATPLQPSLTSPPSPAPPAASTPAAQHSQAAHGATHTLPAMRDHEGSPVSWQAQSDQAALHAESAPRSKSTSVGVCGEEGWGALRPGSGGAGAWRGGVGWGGEAVVEAAVEEEEGGPGADEQWRAALVARLQQLDVREEEADRVWALQSPWPPSTAAAQPALSSKL